MPERTIAVRVDEELFQRVKIRLAEKDCSMKDYIIGLLEEDLEKAGIIETHESVGTYSIVLREFEAYLRKKHSEKK